LKQWWSLPKLDRNFEVLFIRPERQKMHETKIAKVERGLPVKTKYKNSTFYQNF
jgi:hypothetical protein